MPTYLKARIMRASVGSCTCSTKTPNPEYHTIHCRYRVLMDALSEINSLTGAGTDTAVKHDPHSGPCPTCGFHIRKVERRPIIMEDDQPPEDEQCKAFQPAGVDGVCVNCGVQQLGHKVTGPDTDPMSLPVTRGDLAKAWRAMADHLLAGRLGEHLSPRQMSSAIREGADALFDEAPES